MSVCLSHGGRNVYTSDAPSSEVLVATLNGVAALRRQAGAWETASRSLEGKHISALLVEPTRGVVFAGTHGDGLYASEDGGRTWNRRDRGIESPDFYSLNFIQVDGELRLYAGTEPAHLYTSTDLGETWRDLPALRSVPSVEKWTFPAPPHEGHVKNIAFDPRSPETVYAAVEVGGLFRSRDAGRTWAELSGFYEDVHRIAIRPSDSRCVYLSTGNGIWCSADEGEKWEHLIERHSRIAYPDALIIHPRDELLMFTAGSICSPGAWRETHDADARIARSRDGGRTWEMLANGLPEHIRGNIEAMSMDVWPGGFSLFAGTTDGEVFFSEDRGDSWSTIVRGLPPVSKGGHYRNLQVAGAH